MPTNNEKSPSILEMIWDQMDKTYDEVKAPDDPNDREDIAALKGRCMGLAIALAILYNPYQPDDVDRIRAEAHERWEARQ